MAIHRQFPGGPVDAFGFDLSVPVMPGQIGLNVYLQAWEVDPGASQGVSFTRGLNLVVGS